MLNIYCENIWEQKGEKKNRSVQRKNKLNPVLAEMKLYIVSHIYEVVSESSRTVITVTASVEEDEREIKVTLPKAYCISLPRDTAL
jgi:hypothetical protein